MTREVVTATVVAVGGVSGRDSATKNESLTHVFVRKIVRLAMRIAFCYANCTLRQLIHKTPRTSAAAFFVAQNTKKW